MYWLEPAMLSQRRCVGTVHCRTGKRVIICQCVDTRWQHAELLSRFSGRSYCRDYSLQRIRETDKMSLAHCRRNISFSSVMIWSGGFICLIHVLCHWSLLIGVISASPDSLIAVHHRNIIIVTTALTIFIHIVPYFIVLFLQFCLLSIRLLLCSPHIAGLILHSTHPVCLSVCLSLRPSYGGV